MAREVKLSDSADWQELLTVMSEHLDELPEAVRPSLQKLADGEALVWDSDWVHSQGIHPGSVTVVADGVPVDACRQVLPIRRGYVADGLGFVPAHTLSITHKGKVLAGW